MLALKTCDTIFGNSCNFLGKEALVSNKTQKIIYEYF